MRASCRPHRPGSSRLLVFALLSTMSLMISAWLAQSGCSRERHKRDFEREAQMSACVDGLRAAVSERGSADIGALIAHCPRVCPGLAADTHLPSVDIERATDVIERCRGFCTTAARTAWRGAEPDRAYASLVDTCGPEAYWLNDGRAPLMSDTWLFLVRVYEWLQANRNHADQATNEMFESAGAHAHFTLPLPARVDSLYTLPRSRARREAREVFYVIAELDDNRALESVHAAAVPIARMRTFELEHRPLPGGQFPGQVLVRPREDYDELFRMFEDLHAGRERSSIDATPLVLIDEHAPVSELINAVGAIGVTRVALGVNGLVAAAHPIAIERLTGSSAAPVLRVRPEGGFVLVGTEETMVPPGDDAHTRLESRLSDLSVAFAPLDKVELVLPEGATINDLVTYLDLVATSKFATVLLR